MPRMGLPRGTRIRDAHLETGNKKMAPRSTRELQTRRPCIVAHGGRTERGDDFANGPMWPTLLHT